MTETLLETTRLNPSVEDRSRSEWHRIAELAPQRVKAINAGRTTAIERALGVEMLFHGDIARVSSVNTLPSALTCTLYPMEGDITLWSRIAAAADLAFGARPALRQHLNGKDGILSIMTTGIELRPRSVTIDPSIPTELVEIKPTEEESDNVDHKTPGMVRFECRQGRKVIGEVEVSYLYVGRNMARRFAKTSNDQAREDRSMVEKDDPLPVSPDTASLHSALGMEFGDQENGFDGIYRPYPYCVNYWSTVHGSGLVAFATMGIPEAANGFTVKYHNPAIGEFDPSDPQKVSTKAFYRRREGNRVEVRDEEGKLLISVEFVDAPPRMPDPDGEMVVRMKGKDQEAWEEFERKYGRKMRSAMKRKFPAKADVEGEYGEFVMQLWQAKLASFDPERGLFSHWLLRCLTYHIIDRLRAMGRRAPESSLDAPLVEGHEGGATFSEMLGEYEDPEQILLREEFRTQVRAALSKLKEEHREPIEKVYLDGMSYAEAAAELGLSIGQIKSRIYNGKIELQHRLRQKRKIGRL